MGNDGKQEDCEKVRAAPKVSRLETIGNRNEEQKAKISIPKQRAMSTVFIPEYGEIE